MVAGMPDSPERRDGPDRRSQPRGGRRAEDRDGFAPLVLLVGDKPDVVSRSEAILAKLRFAVSTTPTVEDALRVIPDLRPDLVVASEWDGARIRTAAQPPPVIVVSRGVEESPDELIEEIRRALRAKTPV
jgi:hypothetical protein